MISLIQLLKESINKPKAIFLAGSAGGGKSSTYRTNPEKPTQLDNLLPSSFIVINSDDTYEEMLRKSGIGTDQKNFTPDQLAQASSFQSKARKYTDELLSKSLKDRKNIIIDGTGAASSTVLKKKKQLEDLGYDTFMLMVYVSPLVSLERNRKRDRSLMPSIVLRTWRDVNKTIPIYTNTFQSNFVLINNDPSEVTKFDINSLKPYMQSQPMGKPKTPEEEQTSKDKFNAIVQDIADLSKTIPQSDSLSVAKSKINKFING
jgi:predicted kinase